MPRQKLLDSLHKQAGVLGQQHLLQALDSLSFQELEAFHAQFQTLSSELLAKQREAFFIGKQEKQLSPWSKVEQSSTTESGESLLVEGQVGCVILAGGQGTRLGWSGPKALYPILPEKNMLQILLEKVKKSSALYEQDFPVALMASPLNQQAIHQHLIEQRFYGLQEKQLSIFSQKMLPLLDEEGNWFLENPGSIAMGPDGNGGVFQLLATSGILAKWKSFGIKALAILPIDNPLGIPFDAQALDVLQHGADVVAKCVQRTSPEEKVGVFAEVEGKLSIVEYSELADACKSATTESGEFIWPHANINQFVFSMELMETLSHHELPMHIARKKAQAWQRGEISVGKCETFFFDGLPYAKNPKLLLYPRTSTYAPLKNKEGDKSPETVRAHLRGV